jgi:hypothetical protein
MASSPNWLQRYRDGQCDQVWAELRELGGAVRRPGLAQEAQLVCDEMARRARHNVEVIVGRLTGQGYRFHTNDNAQTPVVPWVPPTAQASQHAAWLQDLFGPVPMTVLSWVQIVGDVWLVGTHPQWPESASGDPLVIELIMLRVADPARHVVDLWFVRGEAKRLGRGIGRQLQVARARGRLRDRYMRPPPARLQSAALKRGPKRLRVIPQVPQR